MFQSMLRSPIYRFGLADLCSSPHPTPALELLGENKEAWELSLDRRDSVHSHEGDVPCGGRRVGDHPGASPSYYPSNRDPEAEPRSGTFARRATAGEPRAET